MDDKTITELTLPNQHQAQDDSPNPTPRDSRDAQVLAQVPWLVAAQPTAKQAERPEQVAEQAVVDPSLYQPHQVLASPGLVISTSHATGADSKQQRFDPPQPINPQSVELELPVDLALIDLEADATPATTDQRLRKSVTHAAVAKEAQPNSAPQWRFDQPELSACADDSSAETLETTKVPIPKVEAVPEVEAATETEATLSTQPSAYSIEPSAWHLRVVAIDSLVRKYHRLIMLAALITAASLMMLVLEGQQRSEVLPDSEEPSPTASSSEPLAPALPKVETLTQSDRSPAEATPAAIPSTMPSTMQPPQPLHPLVSTPLQEISQPGQASTARGPSRLAHEAADLVAKAKQPADASKGLMTSTDQPVQSPYQSPYQSTGAPEIVLTPPVKPRARLLGEIQPVTQQAKNDQHESRLH